MLIFRNFGNTSGYMHTSLGGSHSGQLIPLFKRGPLPLAHPKTLGEVDLREITT